MTTAPDIAAVRLTIANAVPLPPMMSSFPAAPIESDEPRNLPRHLRHLAKSFAARLPIKCCGIAEDIHPDEDLGPYSIGRQLQLYMDCNALPRSFDIAGHDRDGIASLFAGDDRLLARLWPSTKASARHRQRADRPRWDHQLAGETLIVEQSRVGLVQGNGFALVAEPPELQRAHLAISRLARRLLWCGLDPYRVLDLARGWNATHGHDWLPDVAVVCIVDAACARELRFEDRRRAG